METSHEHTAIHWKSSFLASSNYFWDIKEYTGKEHVLCNRFYEISFTLIADLVCYATCDIVIFFTYWDKN